MKPVEYSAEHPPSPSGVSGLYRFFDRIQRWRGTDMNEQIFKMADFEISAVAGSTASLKEKVQSLLKIAGSSYYQHSPLTINQCANRLAELGEFPQAQRLYATAAVNYPLDPKRYTWTFGNKVTIVGNLAINSWRMVNESGRLSLGTHRDRQTSRRWLTTVLAQTDRYLSHQELPIEADQTQTAIADMPNETRFAEYNELILRAKLVSSRGLGNLGALEIPKDVSSRINRILEYHRLKSGTFPSPDRLLGKFAMGLRRISRLIAGID